MPTCQVTENRVGSGGAREREVKSIALAILTAVVASVAFAQGNNGPRMRPADFAPGMIGFGMMGGLRTIVALVDTNGDGALSLDEVEAASVRIFNAADAD